MPVFEKTRQRYNEHELILECNCTDIDHLVKVCYYDDEPGFISFCVTLVTWKNFFGRLWDGLKYAFGYTSRYGHFDEIEIDKEDAKELIEFLKGFVNES